MGALSVHFPAKIRELLNHLVRTLGLRFRVRRQEMSEHHQQLASVILVTPVERLVNIVANHVAYPLRAVWFFE